MNTNAKILVRDVMQSSYAMVDGLITVAEAIAIAREQKVKTLIVKKRHDDDEFGIVMLGDIARKVLSADRAPDRINVYEIMTKPALSVEPDMQIKYCARLFERFGISRAPVVENRQVIGMVSYNKMVLRGMSG
ncbi:MAG: CBS domain-containing protein [Shewanella sp.]|nr:CBS domain-containing protein [Shewanella sp.]MCF1429312.1 CBS domain-containing protein [Shewanella sp.]MCF1456540.1 CBS domain-containing protein [Shewanella sp.]